MHNQCTVQFEPADNIAVKWSHQYTKHCVGKSYQGRIVLQASTPACIRFFSPFGDCWIAYFIHSTLYLLQGFPDSSVGKESTCNAGDPSSIPGSGRSTGEGIGYPLQYSWASLVAQLVKNPPAMQETWVRSLAWEDPLEKGKATHSSILAWRIPWTI